LQVIFAKYSLIIKKLGSNHNASDEEAMSIEGSEVATLFLKEPFQVYLCNHKTRRAAIRVLENPFHVLCNTHVWCFGAMKDGDRIIVSC